MFSQEVFWDIISHPKSCYCQKLLFFVLLEWFFILNLPLLHPADSKCLFKRHLQMRWWHLATLSNHHAFSPALERKNVVWVYPSSALDISTWTSHQGAYASKTRSVDASLALLLNLQILLHLGHEIILRNNLNFNFENSDLKDWHLYSLPSLYNRIRPPFSLLLGRETRRIPSLWVGPVDFE